MIMLFISFMLVMINCIKLFYFIRLRRYRPGLVAAFLTLICSLAFWHLVILRDDGLSLPFSALLLILLAVLSLENLRRLIHWRRHNLSEESVKESIELLPTGVCFYWRGGLPKLCNRKMNEICRALTGDNLFDAEHFWYSLTKADMPHIIQGGERPIAVLPDDTAYSFVRHSGTLSGDPIYELIASDITEEYRLTAALREKQEQANLINLRLKAVQSELNYTVMDRELLQIKTRVHDSFGETLLMTRQYLSGTAIADEKALRKMWKTNIGMLRNSEPEHFQKPYFIAKQRAQWLGVELDIRGSLPEEEALIPIIDTALTVHVTNLLRHAEGKTGQITVTENEQYYELVFTNDGNAPDSGIQETGGLQNLRRIVEKAGGSMNISSVPRFELRLNLPKRTAAGH